MFAKQNACLLGGVDVAEGAEGVGGLHQATGGEVEVGVLLNEVVGGVGVELVEGVRDELVGVTAGGGELGHPDVILAAGRVDVAQVGEELLSASLASRAVPVGVAAVHGAVGSAGLLEGVEPVDAGALVLAAGDGRSEDLGLANEGLHEGLVGSSSGTGVHVALAAVVTLVEAHQGVSAGGDGLLGVLGPALAVHRLGSPEGGDEGNGGVKAVGLGAPVVGPAELVAVGADVGDELGVVVSKTTLSALARGGRDRVVRSDSGRNLADDGGRSLNSGLSRHADNGLGRRGRLGRCHHGSRLRSRGLLGRGGRSDNGGNRGRRSSGCGSSRGANTFTLVGLGFSDGRLSAGSGSGSWQVALGDSDSHDVGDDLHLGRNVVPLVEVAVVGSRYDSQEVRGSECRDDVLGEHVCKGMSGYQIQ